MARDPDDAHMTQEANASRREEDWKNRIEFAATVLMAIAAVFTAWAAFQSTKWSGEQADNYSRAAAARTESAKATTLALTQTSIDIQTFIAWLEAYSEDLAAGLVPRTGVYVPDPALLSRFIAARFRDEFRPAFAAWIASRPVVNAEASGTPFELPEYKLASREDAARYDAEADARSAEARSANERGDNYVLLTVLFATALFFAGISGRLDDVRNSAIA